MKWCLEEFSKKDDLIVDRFAGSGTVAVACKQLGMNFVMVEKDSEYISIIETRLKTVDN